jgi:hypothetical protein
MPKPVCPNMATATPLGPPGPRRRRSSTPGCSGRGTEGLCLGAASLHSGHLRGIGPEPGTWKDSDPRRLSSRGSGGSEMACLPGNGGYATPAGCSVSTTSWSYGLRRARRLVTGRSHRPRSACPNQARLALLAVTHRYKRTHCLWLEQFQIADSVPLAGGGRVAIERHKTARYVPGGIPPRARSMTWSRPSAMPWL